MSQQLESKRKTGMKKDLPSLISDFFNSERFFNTGFPSMEIGSKVPAVNIRENNNEFLIDLAAPGLTKEDFRINVKNHTIEISAEKEISSEEKEEKYTKKEYSYESFSRSFNLPEQVKTEEIKAKYDNGVLCITVPKKEEAKTQPEKSIKVS